MKLGRVGDDDGLYRHCVYPVAFSGSKRKFNYAKLWRLYDGENLVEASVAWERLAPSEGYVHEYGCRLAKKRNASHMVNGKIAPDKRQVYCGAYRLLASAVRRLVGEPMLSEVVSADCVHKVEAGEIAHTAVVIGFAADVSDIEGLKTAIIDRLWNQNFGPLLHTCLEDGDINPHPKAGLSSPPLGAYVDKRSVVAKYLCIVRYYVLKFVWWIASWARPTATGA